MTDETPGGGRDPGQFPRAAEITCEIGDAERPSLAVVRAVASLSNTPVLDLDPLYEAVDPTHLDGLVDGSGERSVEFRYSGCQVTVTPDAVHVRTATEDDR